MKLKVLAGLSLALIATSLIGDVQPAYAKNCWKYGVNNRQQRQKNRIQHGVGSGSLTRRETGRLAYQQKALNRQEARFRASGDGLSMKERARLEKEQNQLSQNIYQQKHDGQERGDGNWGNHPNYPHNPGNQLFDINQTQRNQDKRLYNGIQSGELTQKEAQRLDNQQDRFEKREAYLRQDGLTLEERAKLDNAQDRMSRSIYHQKHDKQDND